MGSVLSTCLVPRYSAWIDESRLPWTGYRDRHSLNGLLNVTANVTAMAESASHGYQQRHGRCGPGLLRHDSHAGIFVEVGRANQAFSKDLGHRGDLTRAGGGDFTK